MVIKRVKPIGYSSSLAFGSVMSLRNWSVSELSGFCVFLRRQDGFTPNFQGLRENTCSLQPAS